MITIKDDFEKRLLDVERKISETTIVSAQGIAPSPISRFGMKLSTFDGKGYWSVYKTQLEMVANANGWDDRMKNIHLAASLGEEAAEVLQTLPADKINNLEELVKALDLRFGDCALKDFYRLQLKIRSQKNDESLQELPADIERLSSLAFLECPTDVRDSLSLLLIFWMLRGIQKFNKL